MDSKYRKLLSELKLLSGKTLISFHSRGDVEAIASALALRLLLPQATIGSPDRLGGHARSVLKRLNVSEPGVLMPGELASYDSVVLVDVANPKMLGALENEFKTFSGKKVVIDHHITNTQFKGSNVFEFPNRTSCCEVIFDVLKSSGFQVDKQTAALLLCGAFVDSAGLESANVETFKAVNELMLLSGLTISKVKTLTKRVVELNEINTVKANVANATRLKFKREEVAFCSCKAYESATANQLIKNGVAVAVCFNEKSGDFSVIRNSKSKVFGKLNVAKFLSKAASRFNGECGGHELIAGGKFEVKEVKKVALFLERELRDVFGN